MMSVFIIRKYMTIFSIFFHNWYRVTQIPFQLHISKTRRIIKVVTEKTINKIIEHSSPSLVKLTKITPISSNISKQFPTFIVSEEYNILAIVALIAHRKTDEACVGQWTEWAAMCFLQTFWHERRSIDKSHNRKHIDLALWLYCTQIKKLFLTYLCISVNLPLLNKQL